MKPKLKFYIPLLLFVVMQSYSCMKGYPERATNLYPADKAINVTDSTFAWECSDPDGDALIYDIYFTEVDENLEPILVESGYTKTEYTAKNLKSNTRYFWQIVSIDTDDHKTYSQIWEFTTGKMNK